jgi:glycosyltransferase 2 family protein
MKRLLSLLLSAAILAVIYSKIDLGELAAVFRRCDPGWLTGGLAMVVPLTLLTAYRLQILMPNQLTLPLKEAVGLILSASVLNMVLPSKMGDLAKAYFLGQRGHLSGSLAISLVIVEKTLDLLSLLVWCLFGLILLPKTGPLFWMLAGLIAGGILAGGLVLGSRRVAQVVFSALRSIGGPTVQLRVERVAEAWKEMRDAVWVNRPKLIYLSQVSFLIWFLHLVQVWLFILALKAPVPFLANLGLTPLAILAGLLPVTFAGIGTRDAALIFFYRAYFTAPVGAALGILCTSRYVLPALAGLPFFSRYVAELRRSRGLRWGSP